MSATWDSKGSKATPVGLDEVLIIDTSDSRNQKRATLTSLPTSNIFTTIDFNSASPTPANPALTVGREYVRTIDANNEGLFVKIKQGGAIVEVQLT